MPHFRQAEVVLTKFQRNIKEEYSEWWPQEDQPSEEPSAPAPSTVEEPKKASVTGLEPDLEAKSPKGVKNEKDERKVKKEEMDEKELLNPKHKVDKYPEDTKAGLKTVLSRIEELGIKPFAVDRDEDFLNSTFDRRFFSSKRGYGGNSIDVFPSVGKKHFLRHGMNNFMFMNLRWNPHGPHRAGFPGLYYTLNPELYNEPLRVFVRIQAAHWLYVGTYRLSRCNPLSQQEWLECSSETRGQWYEGVMRTEWGKPIRRRIALRKQLSTLLGREPTPRELRHPAYANMALAVTEGEVQEAFDTGKERLITWAMRCVGYEPDFQQALIDGNAAWTPPLSKEQQELEELGGVKLESGPSDHDSTSRSGEAQRGSSGSSKRKRKTSSDRRGQDEVRPRRKVRKNVKRP